MKNILTIFAELKISKPNNLPDIANPQLSLQGVLTFVFGFFALLAVLLIVIGGVQYTISNGEANKIQEAKNTILYAIIGLIASMIAFVVVGFVTSQLGKV